MAALERGEKQPHQWQGRRLRRRKQGPGLAAERPQTGPPQHKRTSLGSARLHFHTDLSGGYARRAHARAEVALLRDTVPSCYRDPILITLEGDRWVAAWCGGERVGMGARRGAWRPTGRCGGVRGPGLGSTRLSPEHGHPGLGL